MVNSLDSGPGSARPTGTVAFLFTDIEGSTQRWESHRDAMDDAVKSHDALVRDAIERRDGYVFKTVGDAFCVVFARVSDAVAAACEVQRALVEQDFRAIGGLTIRIGVHVGEAAERQGDYFGPAVNRVARLMSIGHGGQILLSSVTRDLAFSDLPAGASLLDLGSHRLKDLTEPEHVWQLSIEGLPAEFPTLRSLDARPNNLPIQRTSFVGREHDVADVGELLERHRLLTLVGSGGIGKTRLALHVGAELLDRYPDGVWFVDLAPISDPELVSSVTAQALGMRQQQDQRVDETIAQWLKPKTLLIIFDNCEHMLESTARIVTSIVTSAPQVAILTTSRQALDITGEIVHRLPPLPLPADIAGLTAETALQYGAILLFANRAAAADTRFTLTDHTAPIVAEVCKRLDGIPLAIELAAARVKILSIPNLAQRLDERFRILTGGSRDALPRQKTLSAMIDWSYDLLTPQEQLLFARLGVFAGGFGLDAATSVCGGEDLDELDIFDLLSSLTDKSLVVTDTAGERERCHLLESTRAYALKILVAAGEHERLAHRHAAYFCDRAHDADERVGTGSTAAWLTSVELELDNYRAVLEWALKGGHDLALGGAVAGALGSLWFHGGLTEEGQYWIRLAQAGLAESMHPLVAARMWRTLGVASSGKRKRDCAQRALALYQSVGDEKGQAWALHALALSLYQMAGRLEEASDASARALAAMRAVADAPGVIECLNMQAIIHWARGDVVAAREEYTKALAAYTALGGDEAGAAVVLGNLAELEFGDGQVEQAVRLAEEALGIQSRGKNASTLADSYLNLAAYRIALGDMDGARETARTGLHWARQTQYALGIAIALQHIALLLALRGEVSDAARLIGYVNLQYKELGSEREATETWSYEKLIAALHEPLSEAAIDKLAAEGATWSEDRAIEAAHTA
ncbi:MAG TPA: adenylate/guanylate cyclase domain-containing protein [Candidatus Tumulicola sp.]|jgi:predicted ATPase/class 3 adenylate cyclase